MKRPSKILAASGLMALLSGPLLADKIEDSIARDFPKFSIFKKTMGDLNGDGIVDYALILWATNSKKAPLVVYFGDNKGAFHLQSSSQLAICVGCGGPKAIMGEPLGDLNINAKGILLITCLGGSREVWIDVLKWRFDKKQKEFLLIGETYRSVDNFREEPTERTDINYSTGKIENSIGKKRRVCQFVTSSIKLTSFDFANNHLDDLDRITNGCSTVRQPGPEQTKHK